MGGKRKGDVEGKGLDSPLRWRRGGARCSEAVGIAGLGFPCSRGEGEERMGGVKGSLKGKEGWCVRKVVGVCPRRCGGRWKRRMSCGSAK